MCLANNNLLLAECRQKRLFFFFISRPSLSEAVWTAQGQPLPRGFDLIWHFNQNMICLFLFDFTLLTEQLQISPSPTQTFMLLLMCKCLTFNPKRGKMRAQTSQQGACSSLFSVTVLQHPRAAERPGLEKHKGLKFTELWDFEHPNSSSMRGNKEITRRD